MPSSEADEAQVLANLDKFGRQAVFCNPRGAVAQLGEHKAGSLGVRGSSPLSSTNFRDSRTRGRRCHRKTACPVVFSILISCRKAELTFEAL